MRKSADFSNRVVLRNNSRILSRLQNAFYGKARRATRKIWNSNNRKGKNLIGVSNHSLAYEALEVDRSCFWDAFSLSELAGLRADTTTAAPTEIPEEFRNFDLIQASEEMRKLQRRGRGRAANVVESEVDSVMHECHLEKPEDLIYAINRATTLELGTEVRCKN